MPKRFKLFKDADILHWNCLLQGIKVKEKKTNQSRIFCSATEFVPKETEKKSVTTYKNIWNQSFKL
jgi:hypothetical protein